MPVGTIVAQRARTTEFKPGKIVAARARLAWAHAQRQPIDQTDTGRFRMKSECLPGHLKRRGGQLSASQNWRRSLMVVRPIREIMVAIFLTPGIQSTDDNRILLPGDKRLRASSLVQTSALKYFGACDLRTFSMQGRASIIAAFGLQSRKRTHSNHPGEARRDVATPTCNRQPLSHCRLSGALAGSVNGTL